MYFNRKKHILSKTLMLSALINCLAFFLQGASRLIINKANIYSPDMMDTAIHNFSMVVSVLQLFATALVFYIAWKSLKKDLALVEEGDYYEMGRLQEEVFGKNVSTLNADSIKSLLEIWAVILVGVGAVYDVSSLIYRNFIIRLSISMQDHGMDFVSLYNLTHGFKYLEMFIAILIGVVMTGIFLNEKFLKIIAICISVAFILSFAIFESSSIQIFGRYIGVVWTSVIFHLTDTVGLFALALYLRKRYIGV
ncbi:MAG: hypothetical protein K6F99_02660 [Lachnospiraceae bacterium]|nr:hypothetical protein [Lachnospiraceae bacterium]